MRFIANCLLKDGGVLYAVVNASSESSAKQMIVNKSQALPKRYILTRLNTIKVEKWPTSTKTQIKNGGSHIFEFYFVDTQGMLGNGKLKSLGVKSTATNLFANPRIKGKLTSSAILFLFDETDFKERRKQAKHSAMAQAKETIQNKARIIGAYNDAIAKCETLQNFEMVTQMNLLLGMVLDKISGDYKDVPLNTIIGATACILYFVSPIDLVPDCIPVVGKLDDAVVVKFALDACGPDLERYAKWRESQGRVAIQGKENQVKMKLPEGSRKERHNNSVNN